MAHTKTKKQNSKKLNFHDKDNWVALLIWLVVTVIGVFQTATGNGGKFNPELLQKKGYWAWFIAPSHLIFIGIWLIIMLGILISFLRPIKKNYQIDKGKTKND